MIPDSRLTPARPDLAAAYLRGVIDAPRYVEGEAKRIILASVPLRAQPNASTPWDTEALYGEALTLYDCAEGWAWVRLERDGYVGYLPAAALGAPSAPTHRVAVLRTHAYPSATIKAPSVFAPSLGAGVVVADCKGEFAVTADGLHFFSHHLASIDAVEPDFVAVAERFVNVPYLWGGRTSEGIDCSGLVQTALRAAGIAAPRDSDMLEAQMGSALSPDAPLRRGDLVFWRGHVGMMMNADTLLHANGHHMLVVAEPFTVARDRIMRGAYGVVTSVRRL